MLMLTLLTEQSAQVSNDLSQCDMIASTHLRATTMPYQPGDGLKSENILKPS
jgi:hypothetical protein